MPSVLLLDFNLTYDLLTLKALPYCKVHFKEGRYELEESVEALMLDILAKKFNFRYQVIYANQSWGTIENGVWIGSVGHVFNKVCILLKTKI